MASFRITFDFTEVDPVNHRLGIDGRIPFGIKVREDMKLIRVDDVRCRVNYNCDFTLPPGLGGRILWLVLRRGIRQRSCGFPFSAQARGGASLQAVAR